MPEERVSIPGTDCVGATWSPDGTHLAIKATDGLYVVDYPVRTPPSRIFSSSTGRYLSLKWSGNGKSLAFRPYPKGRNDIDRIVAYDVGTGQTRDVVSGVGSRFRDFAWTQGNELVYRDEASKDKGVRTIRSHKSHLAEPPTTFVWLEGRDRQLKLWIGDTDNRSSKEIEAHGSWWNPVVSPSGNLIAVRTTADGSRARCVVVLAPSGRVTHSLPAAFHFSEWSGDGRFMVGYEQEYIPGEFTDQITRSDIALVDTRDWRYATVVTEGTLEERPSWSQKSGKIAYAHVDKSYITIGSFEEKKGDSK